ncbi:hypothetical protein PP899_gp61 [Agrobacterium phage Atu_ph08]|jgi:hypothetical protein|uniref:Uncharacterized protein n=1 Tax=Agrobacterium phage Atu_ph08 TaxID=2024265 RepID=A0A2L0V132_9CAUD|nr:hypothetical protein [Agrobacterium pusense]YP_010660352.1 hypothetical protein PP899_gp61 [Agrobacterium phage Atu_ph08]AUZ95481.1 hypothetical protein [Agrobacterium phage Atu_ph08]MDR6189205.1 hypothetical protein [Agrobacterium pusense]
MTKQTSTPFHYQYFLCRRATNGGWTLEYEEGRGMVPNVIGAFTTPADLLLYLSAHITENGLEEVTPPARDQEGGAA